MAHEDIEIAEARMSHRRQVKSLIIGMNENRKFVAGRVNVRRQRDGFAPLAVVINKSYKNILIPFALRIFHFADKIKSAPVGGEGRLRFVAVRVHGRAEVSRRLKFIAYFFRNVNVAGAKSFLSSGGITEVAFASREK